MTLFNLPPEVVRLIFRYIVYSREFRRVMRIRLVNCTLEVAPYPCHAYTSANTLSPGQFKFYIDDTVFSLRVLSQFVHLYSPLGFLHPETNLWNQAWSSYAFSYLAYQARREGPTTSSLGRVYRAAEAFCEQNSDSEAFATCLNSLVRLASLHCLRSLLQGPVAEAEECPNSELEADLAVAAVYLGRKSYVEGLIAGGTRFLNTLWTPDVHSNVFGYAFRAATLQGNLDIIKLFLSFNSKYRDAALSECQWYIIYDACCYDYRAAFDFAFDLRPIRLSKAEAERRMSRDRDIVEGALYKTRWPDHYERAAAILGPEGRVFKPPRNTPTRWLTRSVSDGKEEMVRYFLGKGVSPNFDGKHKTIQYLPLLSAICHRQWSIFKILVDAGADPSQYPKTEQLLMEAAWAGNVQLMRFLTDRGLDVNEGFPCAIALAVITENTAMFRLLRERGARLDTPETGGWAMALATLHGLDSMVDLLVREGVPKDYILHRVGRFNEINWWYKRLWPVSP